MLNGDPNNIKNIKMKIKTKTKVQNKKYILFFKIILRNIFNEDLRSGHRCSVFNQFRFSIVKYTP
jgi:hypothetical protein